MKEHLLILTLENYFKKILVRNGAKEEGKNIKVIYKQKCSGNVFLLSKVQWECIPAIC